MGTIFVAYGEPDTRERVLEFAGERARESGDDLFVYHVQEFQGASVTELRAEVAAVLERVAPDVEYEVDVSIVDSSDHANVSTQKRLLDALLGGDREFEYAVMGNVEHGMLESLSLSSLTETVLETREIPVLLVPV